MDPDDLYIYVAADILESLYTAVEKYNVLAAEGFFHDFDTDVEEGKPKGYQKYALFGYLFEKNGIEEIKRIKEPD